MGRNAQRRRVARDNARLAAPVVSVSAFRHTKTRRRLEAAIADVQTVAQFEEMLSQARPEVRAYMERELRPLLSPELPCCGQQMLEARDTGKALPGKEHGVFCPLRKVVLQ